MLLKGEHESAISLLLWKGQTSHWNQLTATDCRPGTAFPLCSDRSINLPPKVASTPIYNSTTKYYQVLCYSIFFTSSEQLSLWILVVLI